jgi:hypothetical protein
MNMLLLNALERYSFVYGDDYKLEYPTGSGQQRTLIQIAEDIARRLVNLFLPDNDGRRPEPWQRRTLRYRSLLERSNPPQ